MQANCHFGLTSHAIAVLLDVDPPLLLVAALLATVQTVPHRGGDDLVELGG